MALGAPTRTVGLYLIVAVLVGVISFLTALVSGRNTLTGVTEAILIAALVSGIVAAYRQYTKTGSVPGPEVPAGTLITAVLVAVYVTAPALLSAPATSYLLVTWALSFVVVLEEELSGMPISIPGLSSILAKPPSNPPQA